MKKNISRFGRVGLMIIALCAMFAGVGIALANNLSIRQITSNSVEPQAIDLPTNPVPNKITISFKAGTSDEDKQKYIESIGGTIETNLAQLDSVVVNVNSSTTIANLPQSDSVANTDNDYFVSALSTPNDPEYSAQWALNTMNVETGWNNLPTSINDIKVAVIDSGVCVNHPDLLGKSIDGWNFITKNNDVNDDFGHGCSVSGIIAANTNNNLGIAGVAPNVKIMPLKVLDNQGLGSYSNVAAAIVYAVDNGAKIINLSLGGANSSAILENAINYAKTNNVIVVAATGNTGTMGVLYPAKYDYVIAVGSVDANLQRSSFSTYGDGLDIYAPGRDILTTKMDGTYGLVSGTSFAAPQVAGLKALDLALNTTLALNGQVAGVSANKAVNENTTSTINTTVITASNQVTGQQDPSFATDGTSHLFWPFSTTDWALTGNGHGTNTHFGADYYAEDWNMLNGVNDCNKDFNSPMMGTVVASYRSVSGYGNTIVIQSSLNPTFALRIAHLNTRLVNDGDTVVYGQKIGEVGSDGTDNCHAHISLYQKMDQSYNGKAAIENLKIHHEFATSSGSDTTFAAQFSLDAKVYGSVGGYVLLPNASGAVARTGTVYINSSNQGVTFAVPITSNGSFLFQNNIFPGKQNFIAVSNGVYGYGQIFVQANASNQLSLTLDNATCSAQASEISMVTGLANPCTPPTSTGSCPNNANGKYCGVTLGINDNNLYNCTNGNNTLIQQCSNGCSVQAQGSADFCLAPASSKTCPNNQNGNYCGAELALDANTLYSCNNGVTAVINTCQFGCAIKPAGTSDVCKSSSSTGTGTCPVGGNGDYCGATLGLDNTKLYTCTNGSIAQKATCQFGCQQRASGTPDICYPSGSGGTVTNTGSVKFYGDSNYAANLRLTLPVGNSEEPSKSAVYKSIELPSGWSIVLHDHPLNQVGNTQCFSQSIPLLESYGGWPTSIEAVEIFNSNVCNTGGGESFVKICRNTGGTDCTVVTNDIRDLGGSGYGDNVVKSIRFAGNWEAVLYEHGDYQGRNVTLSDDSNDLGGLQFGYGTSSISVRRKDPAIFTLYSLGDFNGSSFASDRAIVDLQHWTDRNQSNQNWGDYAQSIRVANGYQVIVCADADFRGACNRYTSDQANLTNLVRAASSVQICQGTCPAAATRPTLLAPADGSSFIPGTNVVLNWVGDANSYDIVYWGGDLTSNLSDYVKNGGNVVTRTGLAASTKTYYWHVKGYNSYGESDWSPTYSFRIQDIAPNYLYISGDTSVNINADSTYTALISPSNAGNLAYTWSPQPKSGQGTATAIYNWATGSSQHVNLSVSNTGGTIDASIDVNVGCADGKYLAEYYNNPTLSNATSAYSCEDTINNNWGNSGPSQISSNSFNVGDGKDGALDVLANTTVYTDNVKSKIVSDAASGQKSVCIASSAGFSAGDEVMLIQSQGTGAGNYEFNTIREVVGCGFDLINNLTYTYSTAAVTASASQVIKVPHYTTVSVSGTLTVHAWDGSTGGVMAFRALNGVKIFNGTINASGTGYRGPSRTYYAARTGFSGEGLVGTGSATMNPNNGGGGGGTGTNDGGGGAGGGSYRSVGGNSGKPFYGSAGIGSPTIYGTNDLTKLFFGGSGGAGGTDDSAWDGSTYGGNGGAGGGIIYIETNKFEGNGNIFSRGANGENRNGNGQGENGGGGGGAGGSIKILADKVNTDNITFAVNGGSGGSSKDGQAGGGGNGQSYIQYCSNLSTTALPGTTALAANCNKDNYSVRWTGKMNFTSGSYKFESNTDDGNKVWVDGNLVIDKWIDNAGVNQSSAIGLAPGIHTVKMQYYKKTGTGVAILNSLVQPVNNQPIVLPIPSQTITRSESFATINLANYVTDADVGDTITWSYSGNTNIAVNIANNVATLTYPGMWYGSEVIRFTATDSAGASSNATATFTINQLQVDGTELLTEPWHLSGNDGASELYTGIATNSLQGKNTLRITYDLHGATVLGGDASAIIFDQNGWQFVSLSDYGVNGYDGVQTVDVPLSDFVGFDSIAGTDSLHTRFWYGSAFTVDIYSILAIYVGPTVVTCSSTQYTAEYFNNKTLSGTPDLTRCEDSIDYDWGGNSPDASINANNFSVRWTKSFDVPTQNNYTFTAHTDDGDRVYVDDVLVIDNFKDHGTSNDVEAVNLAVGTHTLKVEYYENEWDAVAKFNYAETPGVCPVGQYQAEYFNNKTLSGAPVLIKCEKQIDNDWGMGSPNSAVNADNFSVRWSGTVNMLVAGDYTFIANTDDGDKVWVDGNLVINNFVDHGASNDVAVVNLTAGNHSVKMEYYDSGWNALARLSYAPPLIACSVGQYQALYYNNKTLSGAPVVSKCENVINNDWGMGSPDAAINADNFSVKWTGVFNMTVAGVYTFEAHTDDGERVYVDDVLVINNFTDHGTSNDIGTANLTAGNHTIRVEYYDSGYSAVAKFLFYPPVASCRPGTNSFCVDYFNSKNLGGAVAYTTTEATINHDWGYASPASGVSVDDFSGRWAGNFIFTAGNHTFTTSADDGVRLYVDGVLVIDNWVDQGTTTKTVTLNLTAGNHLIKEEYYDSGYTAVNKLSWN